MGRDRSSHASPSQHHWPGTAPDRRVLEICEVSRCANCATVTRKVTTLLLLPSADDGRCDCPYEKTIRSMKTSHSSLKIGLLLVVAAMFTAAPARAVTYSWTNFQSDIAGVAQHVDPNLVNPWGMAVSSGGTIWVSDNGTGVSTLYGQNGIANPLVVEIPTAKQNRDTGNPTGVVFNTTPSFPITKNGTSLRSIFIFVSEDGSISGWNPNLDQTHAIIAVDNGTNHGVNRAIYKGVTLGVANGHNFLYATDFHTGKVHTF